MADSKTQDQKPAIVVEKISKTFKLPHEKHNSVKSLFVGALRKRKKGYEMQKALNNINFEINPGEFFGIVGRNGSGKSTLLKMLAGIYEPTKGSITINGKLTPFIELGVGFNPELTGRENVFLNGALLGFNRKEMLEMYDEIVEFAELERFMDQKLKNYSSGMQVRLAFSIAIRAKSDILLIDEVLAVGDAAFQQKCYEYFRKLKLDKKTVVFVSHDRGAVENFCDRCLLIDNGKVIAEGTPTKILNQYNEITLEQMSPTHDIEEDAAEDVEEPAVQASEKAKNKKRWGNKDIEIIRAKIISGKSKFLPNEMIEIKVDMKINKNISEPVYGIVIRRSDEKQFLTTNTKVEGIETGKVKAGSKVSITYSVKNIFGNGRYTISPAAANQDTNIFFDWREGLTEFFVAGWDDTYADLHPPHTISIEGKK